MRIKQSFCYGLYKPESVSLSQLFAEAAKIGFPAVELWHRGEDFDELISAARQNHLVVVPKKGTPQAQIAAWWKEKARRQ